jgi:hypothetical protein
VDEFIYNNFKHILCFLILISRLGDIISTYLVTPTLKLEANPVVKKLGWRFAWLSVFVCLVPYYHTGVAVIILVPSLLVSASNIGKVWFVRTMGETEYSELVLGLVRRSKFSHVLFGIFLSSFFIFLAGLVLLFLCPDTQNWGWWFGIGIVTYGIAMASWYSIYFCRLFKSVRNSPGLNTEESKLQENE